MYDLIAKPLVDYYSMMHLNEILICLGLMNAIPFC